MKPMPVNSREAYRQQHVGLACLRKDSNPWLALAIAILVWYSVQAPSASESAQRVSLQTGACKSARCMQVRAWNGLVCLLHAGMIRSCSCSLTMLRCLGWMLKQTTNRDQEFQLLFARNEPRASEVLIFIIYTYRSHTGLKALPPLIHSLAPLKIYMYTRKMPNAIFLKMHGAIKCSVCAIDQLISVIRARRDSGLRPSSPVTHECINE